MGGRRKAAPVTVRHATSEDVAMAILNFQHLAKVAPTKQARAYWTRRADALRYRNRG